MARTASTNAEPHRALKIDSADPQRGEDVRALQGAVNRRLRARGLDRYCCSTDGAYGPATALACRKAAWSLGGLLATIRLVTQAASGRLTIGSQRMIRYPGRREQGQLDRARSRQDEVQAAAKAASTGGAKPHEDLVYSVRNQSSRGGVKPRVIVLHSTESSNVDGLADLRAIASWFSNPAAQASSHVATDGEGHTARYVPDDAKAWHVAACNSWTLGIEQIGRAAQTSWTDAELRATAAWCAYWSRKYGIPLTHSTTSGVCRHSDLGAAGGGHHDPGTPYPLDRVLEMARSML